MRGNDFGEALADLVDDVTRDAIGTVDGTSGWAVLALGSYARRELTPGSDVDIMLLHPGGRRSTPSADDAGALWYPLWDAGFALGQSVRTVKEALALADDDLDALTALLDLRLVAGDRALADDLARRVRALAPRRRDRVVDALASAAAARLEQPGPIAEMLEPDLKNGGGGLRDVQAPGWAAWSLPAGGEPDVDRLDGRGWDAAVAVLVARGLSGRRRSRPAARGSHPIPRRPGRAPPRHRWAFRPVAAAGPGRGGRARGRGRRRRSRAAARRGRAVGRVDHARPLVTTARDGGRTQRDASNQSRSRRRGGAARRPGHVRTGRIDRHADRAARRGARGAGARPVRTCRGGAPVGVHDRRVVSGNP